MPLWFRDWLGQHYDDLLRRVTRRARNDAEIAQEALAEVMVDLRRLWGECEFNEQGGEWHVTHGDTTMPFRDFLVQRAVWQAADLARERARDAGSFPPGQAEAVPERPAQPDVPATCREIAETLAALRPCLDELTFNYRAAVIDAMLENGDIPPECEHLAYRVVPQEDLAAWRSGLTGQQGPQARYHARS